MRATSPDGQPACCLHCAWGRGEAGEAHSMTSRLGRDKKWRREAPRDSKAAHTQARSCNAKERTQCLGVAGSKGHPTSRAQTLRFSCTCHSRKGGQGRGSDLSSVPLSLPSASVRSISSFISKLYGKGITFAPPHHPSPRSLPSFPCLCPCTS